MRRIDYRKALPWVAGLVLCGPTFAQGPGGLANPAAAGGQGGQAARPPQGSAAGQAAPNQPAAMSPAVDPATAQRMNQLLKEWEERGKGDQGLYAKFTRTDKTVGALEPKKFQGIAWLQRPDKACIQFEEMVAGQPKPVFHERIIATGEAVYHFRGPERKGFIYPLNPDHQRRELQEGPLPFMFNMQAAEAKRRFDMQVVKEIPAKDDQPAKCYIKIIPLLPVDREEYHQAVVLLNLETFLPEALRLWGPNDKDTKDYLFQEVQRNPTISPAYFNGRKMAEDFKKPPYGYKVEVVQEAPVPPPAGAGRVGQPSGRPAQPASRPDARPGRRR